MEADTVTPTPEKPVFAATGDARPRALKLIGRTAAGLVGLWLVALVLGAFGFGHVPGFQLPRIVGSDHPKSEKASLETRKPARTEPIVASAATRIARSRQVAKRSVTRGGPSGGSGTRRHSGSTRGGGGTSGGGRSTGNTANTTTVTGNGGTSGNNTSTSTPAASTPATTTSPGNSGTHSNSTHSNSTATPPGSSSTAPGSRSQSSTAPGQTSTTPTPGAGQGNGNGNKPAG